MEYKEIILASIQTLRTNVLRTALTMLGIIIGISSVILISSIGQSAVKFVTNEISQFGTNFFAVAAGADVFSSLAGGSGSPLTMDDVDAIRDADIPNIDAVAPAGFASRTIVYEDEKKSGFVYGFTSDVEDIFSLDQIYGTNIQEGDMNSRVVVLGSEISDELFGEGVDPTGNSVKIDNLKFKVIGVVHAEGLAGTQFNRAVTIPLEVMQQDITGNDDLYEIDISVHEIKLMSETIEEVEEVLREHRDIDPEDESDFNITNVEETLGLIQTVTGLLTALIAGISAISLVVGGVGVMNIMLVSVTERTKEIGLLKSIGAKENDILMQFLIESVVMSMTGGIIGITIGVSLSLIITTAVGLPVGISFLWIGIAVIVSSIVGIVFGLYPAKRAAKLSPIDALRYE